MSMSVMVITAHPDDEVLGCGGTIARLIRAGENIHIAILGEGIAARYPGEENPTQLLEQLHDCSRQAATILGAKDISFHNLPDNRLDTVPLLDVIKIIEELVDRYKPHTIYTHHGSDLNIDHQVIHRAVLTATRPTREQSVRQIYAFEVPSSTDWAFQQIEPPFHPNFFMDITNYLATKLKALACYETELRAFPHPRSPEAIEALARRWGSTVGCEAAEAFELIRAIS